MLGSHRRFRIKGEWDLHFRSLAAVCEQVGSEAGLREGGQQGRCDPLSTDHGLTRQRGLVGGGRVDSELALRNQHSYCILGRGSVLNYFRFVSGGDTGVER